MKKVMIGLAAASFTALLAVSGAQAQSGTGQTGMGDAGQKGAPTTAGVGQKPGMSMGSGMGMRMKKKHRKHRRHM